MRIVKSTLAVLAGLIFIFISHSLADFILESTGVFPSPNDGLHDTWMLLLALAYRVALSVAGCWLTAKLAPQDPMKHSLILGFIGVFLGAIGAAIAAQMNLSPIWYPIALIALTLPCAWLGGKLATRNVRMA